MISIFLFFHFFFNETKLNLTFKHRPPPQPPRYFDCVCFLPFIHIVTSYFTPIPLIDLNFIYSTQRKEIFFPLDK